MKGQNYIAGVIVTLLALPFLAGWGNEADATVPGLANDPVADPTGERRPVDLVICLDTSGSMTALIDSARAKLWDVVNELAKAEPMPRLRVGLLTYGSPNLSTAEQGWVFRQLDLTNDLDTVHAKMMAMVTNGGEEYVGWVLNDALNTMSWSTEPDALKLIFVAGNESADQASTSYNFRHVAEAARSSGIVINAIYAGHRNGGIAEHWDEVATHGGGYYASIDMQAGTVQFATPQDALLGELNAKLNATYVPYGARGRAGLDNQREQDANAERLGGQSAGSRVAAKASALYDNAVWDLVDASKEEGFDLEEVEEEALPAAMQPMAPAERQAYVDGMRASREAIQKKIHEVSAARDAYLEAERKKQGGQTSLDEAMRKALRDQASARGFTFENDSAEPAATNGTSSPKGSAEQS